MSEREIEKMLEQVLQRDPSVGTEQFREDLLARCLEVLGADDDEAVALDDEELDLLSAAGDMSMLCHDLDNLQ